MDVERIRRARPSVDQEFSEETCRSLDAMMREARAFLDPDLSLDKAAARLSIRPDQLSAVVNARLGKNFAAYVNSFRVEYAERRLVSDMDSSVLDIGLECGFNSKSVFNDAFRKATGLTPTEYRKKKTPTP
jgi:AraC-like DNA-binding protein